MERGQFGHHRHENNNNKEREGVANGLHFPHPIHGHPPFLNPHQVPNFAQGPSKIKSPSHLLGVPFYHLPPPMVNPMQEFKYQKQMR